MKKYLSLGMGIFSVVIVIISFFGNMSDTASILGFEVNIWIYRLVWSIFAVVLIFSYLREVKKTKANYP